MLLRNITHFNLRKNFLVDYRDLIKEILSMLIIDLKVEKKEDFQI